MLRRVSTGHSIVAGAGAVRRPHWRPLLGTSCRRLEDRTLPSAGGLAALATVDRGDFYYAHGEPVAATLDGSTVRFARPHPRVAPGQVVALYDGDLLVGGG